MLTIWHPEPLQDRGKLMIWTFVWTMNWGLRKIAPLVGKVLGLCLLSGLPKFAVTAKNNIWEILVLNVRETEHVVRTIDLELTFLRPLASSFCSSTCW